MLPDALACALADSVRFHDVSHCSDEGRRQRAPWRVWRHREWHDVSEQERGCEQKAQIADQFGPKPVPPFETPISHAALSQGSDYSERVPDFLQATP